MGATNFVITPAQQSITKILAVTAGFAKFLPMPPKSILTMMIAKAAPTIAT